MVHTPCSDLVGQVNRKMAETYLSIIALDVDAVPIIDYLGSAFRREFGSPFAQDTLKRCLAFIRREHERFSKSGDHKHALRYLLLRQYYERNAMDDHELCQGGHELSPI